MQPRRFSLRLLRLPLALALLLLAATAVVACAGEEPPPLGPNEVEFASTDGVTLRGRHYGQGDVIVVLAHMLPADQESWAPFAEKLAAEGYAAFTFNFRGYPPSQGDWDAGLIDLDLGGALDYLDTQGVERPVLVGASIGGTAAVMAAANRDVAGLITLSAPMSIDGLDASEAITRVTAPKLFMVAEDDVEARAGSAALYGASSDPRFYDVFRGGEHGSDLVYGMHSELVQERILEFLEQFRQ